MDDLGSLIIFLAVVFFWVLRALKRQRRPPQERPREGPPTGEERPSAAAPRRRPVGRRAQPAGARAPAEAAGPTPRRPGAPPAAPETLEEAFGWVFGIPREEIPQPPVPEAPPPEEAPVAVSLEGPSLEEVGTPTEALERVEVIAAEEARAGPAMVPLAEVGPPVEVERRLRVRGFPALEYLTPAQRALVWAEILAPPLALREPAPGAPTETKPPT